MELETSLKVDDRKLTFRYDIYSKYPITYLSEDNKTYIHDGDFVSILINAAYLSIFYIILRNCLGFTSSQGFWTLFVLLVPLFIIRLYLDPLFVSLKIIKLKELDKENIRDIEFECPNCKKKMKTNYKLRPVINRSYHCDTCNKDYESTFPLWFVLLELFVVVKLVDYLSRLAVKSFTPNENFLLEIIFWIGLTADLGLTLCCFIGFIYKHGFIKIIDKKYN